MPDDKSKKDARDRSKVASEEDYEVKYLAEKTDISVEQARELIRKYGDDRRLLEELARRLRGAT